MTPWRLKRSLVRGPKVQTAFEPLEREAVGDLAADLADKLMERARTAPRDELAEMMDMPSGHKEPPADLGLARLLPDFERAGDEEFDGDNALLRSLHETDIIRAKLQNLRVVTDALGPDGGVEVTLSEEEAHLFVAALNDLRLYLSAADPAPEGLIVDRELLIEWLATCQDGLLSVLLGE